MSEQREKTRAKHGVHLIYVGSAEPLRLVVYIVAADALENDGNLTRFERLPLLEKGALHDGALHWRGRRACAEEHAPGQRVRSR